MLFRVCLFAAEYLRKDLIKTNDIIYYTNVISFNKMRR